MHRKVPAWFGGELCGKGPGLPGDLAARLTLWVHLRTTNPIESTFSTVRLRTKVTRGAGSRKAALAMTYKLVIAAQDRWRRITGAELVALVRAGATFIDGKLQERSINKAEPKTTTRRVAAKARKTGSVAA